MPPVLALVLSSGGTPDDVSLQGLALASRLAAGDAVHALVVADEPAAGGLAGWGATQVHVATHPALASFAPDAIAHALASLATEVGAAAVVGPGTEAGNTILARAAARAGLPFAANCVAATLGPSTGGDANGSDANGSDGDGRAATVTRLRWGGSLHEESAVHASPLLLTVAAHVIPAQAVAGGTASVATFTPDLDESDTAVRVVSRIPAAAGGVSLSDAKVVVSGGRGAGSVEGFQPIEELAALLGAAVGCSRAVTMAGWRSHTDQVGQTGTKIAPNLYIACGISGATQHMAGAKGAKKLLAINKDGEAPIMAAADYAVIGDLHAIVPAISAEIRRVRGA
jgi:electron transfer flavoprotein alpha subunit